MHALTRNKGLSSLGLMEKRAVRRQQRGLRRIDDILDAASVVFARDGIQAATTNQIAREAGISPGSLYRFFSDKTDIATTLSHRYAVQLGEAHQTALRTVDLVSASLPEVLNAVLDPIIAFKNSHTAFVALIDRTDLPSDFAEPISAVDTTFANTITSILRQRNPDAPAHEVQVAALTMINLFRGVMGGLGSVTGNADADLSEVKKAFLGYLDQKGLR
jgi:AcrR family transcriptional regulator